MYFRTSNPNAINQAIDCIRKLTGVWEISITKYKKNRSLQQSRLYWLWLNVIAEETGNNADDLHEIFKFKFLGSETVTAFGYKIERPKSTTKLTTVEFTNYLDEIDALMLSINIRLPKPDDLYFEAMGCK